MISNRGWSSALGVALLLLTACEPRGGGSVAVQPDQGQGGAGGLVNPGGSGGSGGSGGENTSCLPTPPVPTCAGVVFRPCEPVVGTNGATRLRGTIVSPDEVICDGEVLIDRGAGRILCVGESCADEPLAAQASVLCGDLITPGLIDPHNHMSYNTLPRWHHEGPTFANRGQWNGPVGDELYDALFEPDDPVAARYSELRLLMAGTTSVHKSQAPAACLDGVRNLDRGEDGNDLGYANDDFTECVFPLRDNCTAAPDYAAGRGVPARRYVAHVSEGFDAVSHQEFEDFVEAGQLGEKTSIVHCVSCDGPQLTRMLGAGTHLVWSPQSNIELYGVTTNVPTAKAMGLTVAIGTDWTPSGTMNQLAEMKCAAHVGAKYYGGRIDARDVVRMVTSDAAKAMGVDDLVGRLEVGKVADVVAFKGDRQQPYDAIVAATNADIQAVFIGGEGHFGDTDRLDASNQLDEHCEVIDVCGVPKKICVKSQPGDANPAVANDWPKFSFADHLKYLEDTLAQKPGASGEFAYAYNLYPLFECAPVFACDLGNASVSGAITETDHDGDDHQDNADNCPDIFNPDQGDLDEDGRGDGCDVCPWSAVDCPCRVPIAGDRDGDGVADAMDLCPEIGDPQQADRDQDGIGDVCDFCPDAPSEAGCPTTIYAVKRGEVPATTAVQIGGVVTAVVPVTGNFFLQVPSSAAEYTGPEQSGLFVFLGGGQVATPPAVGDQVIVSGRVNDFFGQKQVSQVSALQVLASGAERPAPVVATPEEVSTGGARAAALEGVRICVEDVEVTAVEPPPGPGEMAPTMEFVVGAALRVNDLFFAVVPPPALGEHFNTLCGVLRFANGNSKLEPTGPADLSQGPPQLLGFEPMDTLVRVGPETVPVSLDGRPLRVLLSGPAGPGGETIDVSSGAPLVLTIVGPVVVPAGESSVEVRVHALSAPAVPNDRIELTASLADRGVATTSVRVVSADAVATTLTLTPESVDVAIGAMTSLRARLDLPAPAAGLTLNFAASNALVTVPMQVQLQPGAVFVEVPVTAGPLEGEATVTVSSAGLEAVSRVRVVAAAAGTGLIINEANIDMAGTEEQEFIELYNASNQEIALSTWRLELVNGRGNVVYATFPLAEAGVSLPAGGYLVVADVGVAVAEGALVLRLPSNANGNHNIENGDPDGLRLIDGANPDAAADGLSYGGPMPGTSEGESSGPDDPGAGEETVGRCPSGMDTNDNAADFSLNPGATPGAVNTCL